jgi:hypothetical protein
MDVYVTHLKMIMEFTCTHEPEKGSAGSRSHPWRGCGRPDS